VKGNSKKDFVVEERAQLEALASPKRVEIVDLVTAMGPCSAAEIAREMDVAADALYYHLKKLVGLGLLLEVGKRASTTRHETLYDVPGALNLRYSLSSSPQDVLKKTIASVLRLSLRDFTRAIDRGVMGDDALSGGREVGWLSRRELAALNAHLRAAREILRAGKRGRGRHQIALTWATTPIARQQS